MDIDSPTPSDPSSSKTDCFNSNDSPKKTNKIVLKRTHLVTSTAESSDDEIKKSKLELK